MAKIIFLSEENSYDSHTSVSASCEWAFHLTKHIDDWQWELLHSGFYFFIDINVTVRQNSFVLSNGSSRATGLCRCRHAEIIYVHQYGYYFRETILSTANISFSEGLDGGAWTSFHPMIMSSNHQFDMHICKQKTRIRLPVSVSGAYTDDFASARS